MLVCGYICDLEVGFLYLDWGIMGRCYYSERIGPNFYCKVIKDECIRESGRLCPWLNIQIVLEGRVKDDKETESAIGCLKSLVWKAFG